MGMSNSRHQSAGSGSNILSSPSRDVFATPCGELRETPRRAFYQLQTYQCSGLKHGPYGQTAQWRQHLLRPDDLMVTSSLQANLDWSENHLPACYLIKPADWLSRTPELCRHRQRGILVQPIGYSSISDRAGLLNPSDISAASHGRSTVSEEWYSATSQGYSSLCDNVCLVKPSDLSLVGHSGFSSAKSTLSEEWCSITSQEYSSIPEKARLLKPCDFSLPRRTDSSSPKSITPSLPAKVKCYHGTLLKPSDLTYHGKRQQECSKHALNMSQITSTPKLNLPCRYLLKPSDLAHFGKRQQRRPQREVHIPAATPPLSNGNLLRPSDIGVPSDDLSSTAAGVSTASSCSDSSSWVYSQSDLHGLLVSSANSSPTSTQSSPTSYQPSDSSHSGSSSSSVGISTPPPSLPIPTSPLHTRDAISEALSSLTTPSHASSVRSFADLAPWDQNRPGSGNELGRGANGSVHLYRHSKTGVPIAVKIISLPTDRFRRQSAINHFMKEVRFQELMSGSAYFPKFHGHLQMGKDKLGLAMEFVGDETTGKSTTLRTALRTGQPFLSPQDVLLIAADIVEGLCELHAEGVLINDLKDDNILIEQVCGKWVGVLIDLGHSSTIRDPLKYHFSQQEKLNYLTTGNFGHIAPELALYEQFASTASDVFQVGALLVPIGMAYQINELCLMGLACSELIPSMRPDLEAVLQRLWAIVGQMHQT